VTSLSGAAMEVALDGLLADVDPRGPGCVLRVTVDDEPVAMAARGLADIGRARPVGDDVPMYVASVAKQFTGAVVAELVNDGVLHPDQRVGRWLPELSPALGDLALHHLVHHTSGVRDVYALAALAGLPERHLGNPDRVRALIGRQRCLQFPPGSRHSYSNSNYILLAAVVEAAVGMPLSQVAHHRFFGPLGMRSTAFADGSGYPGYLPAPDGWLRRPTPFMVPGPSGLTATARDLARWHGELIARPGLLAGLAVNRPLVTGDHHRYGYGLAWEELGGRRAYAHSGFLPGWAAEALVVPSAGLSVVCLACTSAVPAVTLARRAAAIALDDPAASVAEPQDAPGPGTYLSDDRRSVVRVRHSGDKALVSTGGGALAVSLTSPPTPALPGGARVHVNGDSLTIQNQWMPPERFTLVAEEASEHLPVGDFTNDELELTVQVDHDAIAIRDTNVPLQPVARNIWRGQYQVLGLPLDLVVHHHSGEDDSWIELNLLRAHGLRFRAAS